MDLKVLTEYSSDISSLSISKQKIVFVGDVSVGKTSIINSLLNSNFKETYDVNKFFLLKKIKKIKKFKRN
jgi:GTPase SAR1 family protein